MLRIDYKRKLFSRGGLSNILIKENTSLLFNIGRIKMSNANFFPDAYPMLYKIIRIRLGNYIK